MMKLAAQLAKSQVINGERDHDQQTDAHSPRARSPLQVGRGGETMVLDLGPK